MTGARKIRHARMFRRKRLGAILAAFLMVLTPLASEAKGYSSGGHSYSSHSSSSHSSSFSSGRSSSSGSGSGHTFSSGGGHTFTSGSSSSSRSSGSSFGGSKGFTSSSSGKSYSSGGNSRSSYSSGKSYSSGSDRTFSPPPGNNWSPPPVRPKPSSPPANPSGMTFDTGAARAMKESASQREFTEYKQAQAAKSAAADAGGGSTRGPAYNGPVPPVIPRAQAAPLGTGGAGGYAGGYTRPYSQATTVWYPDPYSYSTRSVRIRNYFAPYWARPVVVYNDNYSSLFWWWLLDQSLEDRALWVYNHRANMDDARYRALVYQDLALENRVAELEQRQTPVDPNYVPTGMDRDLMYTDKYVNHAYANRPTHNGQIFFWLIMAPTAIAVGGFFIWLVFFKRWQTSTA
jgi:hypothetical protein